MEQTDTVITLSHKPPTAFVGIKEKKGKEIRL